MSSAIVDQNFLDEIFPAQRADDFFDALFGGAKEGAYDIRLVCRSVSEQCAQLAFELHQRPGKCLVCNLTYGLPQVFQRHPVINVAGAAKAVAQRLGWEGVPTWDLAPTQEVSPALHCIPFRVERAKA